MDDSQLFLNFEESTVQYAAAPQENTAPSGRSLHSQMQRAVMRWLLDRKSRPAIGCACDISCGSRLPRLDVAAFWTMKVHTHNQRKAILCPTPTVGIICCTSKDECYSICAQPPEAMAELAELHSEMRRREALIRQNEPELQDGSSLFPEYAEWDYSRTSDQEYLKCASQAALLEKRILTGTRLERTLRKGLLSGLYLAVPENCLDAADLPVDCGLLWIHRNLSVEVRREITLREVRPDNQLLLASRIAAAATRSAIELYGVRTNSKGAFFVKPPRLRRKRENPTLPAL